MNENPFSAIYERLNSIEGFLLTIDEKLDTKTPTAAAGLPTYLSSFKELSSFTGIPQGTLRKISKDIPKLKRGRRIVFRVDDITAWLESFRVPTSKQVEAKALQHIEGLKIKRATR